MRNFVITLALMMSSQAFAAAQLVCSAEDGSQVQATISASNELSQIRIQIRDGQLQLINDARDALLDIRKTSNGEKVKSMVITDSTGNILVAVASNAYVDRSGTYSVVQCEVSY